LTLRSRRCATTPPVGLAGTAVGVPHHAAADISGAAVKVMCRDTAVGPAGAVVAMLGDDAAV
jgi:hypothetical protein